MIRKVWPLLLAFVACADNQGSPLQIEVAIAASAPDCVFAPDATTVRSRGIRDVSASSMGALGYLIGVRVTNNALVSTAQPLRFGPITNVYLNQNDVTIDGFNVCYELKNFRTTTEGQTTPPEATFPTCKELAPGERTVFLPASQTIAAGGARSAMSFDVLPPSVTAIDLATSFDRSTSRFLSGLTAVGDRKTVIAHIQAVGHTNAGVRLESNEFLFPVELCVGCVPFVAACPGGIGGASGQVVDTATVCIAGQDEVPTCKDP